MRLLLDTNVLLWWLADDRKLSAKAREAIGNADNAVYVSVVTVWEIVIKRRWGKLELPDNWAAVVANQPLSRPPVTWEHALRVAHLPDVHRDPFDRMPVGQAIEEEFVSVTGDELLAQYATPILRA